jgi:UDP-glucose 4-epimerase
LETIVVTGAFGFLGRHASRTAAQRGARVVGIGHGNWTHGEAQSWRLSSWHERDVTLETLVAHAGAPDLIIHCAGSGSPREALDHPGQDFARTVGTTLEVLEFIRTHSPHTALVYPSTGAVYGHPATIPIAEDAPLAPVSPYGVHKMIAENLIRSYAEHFGVNAAIVRVFSVYGAGLRKQLWWDGCQKVRRGEYQFLGSGNETRDWVAIEDVARLLLMAGERAAPETPAVNCATGIEVSIRDTLTALFAALGTCQKPAFSGVRRPGDPERYAGNPTRALSWGWEPQRTWRDGVAEYARWFLSSTP